MKSFYWFTLFSCIKVDQSQPCLSMWIFSTGVCINRGWQSLIFNFVVTHARCAKKSNILKYTNTLVKERNATLCCRIYQIYKTMLIWTFSVTYLSCVCLKCLSVPIMCRVTFLTENFNGLLNMHLPKRIPLQWVLSTESILYEFLRALFVSNFAFQLAMFIMGHHVWCH